MFQLYYIICYNICPGIQDCMPWHPGLIYTGDIQPYSIRTRVAWHVESMSPASRLVATCMVGRVELDACLAWLVPMSPACRLVATWSVASSLSRLVATCMVGRVELDACLAWLVPMSPACRLVATCMVGRVELDACLAWLVPMSPVCRLVATWSVASSLSRLVATCMVVRVDVASVSVGCNLVGRVELDACLGRCAYIDPA